MIDAALVITFVAPSSLHREQHRPTMLPIVGNGPPGTFVVFPEMALRVSLPTDQIVYADDSGGYAIVGFGGMRYVGADHGILLFARIRELLPEDQLSPARSHTMRLEARWIANVSMEGRTAWPNVGTGD
jgi:hypothetical protein